MEVITNPDRSQWTQLLQRPYTNNNIILSTVGEIISKVKKGGDAALRELTQKFDGHAIEDLEVTGQEIMESTHLLSGELIEAITFAASNIKSFHSDQLIPEKKVEVIPGVTCWRKPVAIDKVGLYIPGGTAPLFSTVLMLGIPASIAGCKEIILCTPPGKDGKVHPAILFAAKLVGITRIFRIGGAQAIAAMAFGTESIPQVYKIFGPGNQYVTAAKQLIQMEGVAIDLPAGPSELCILADESADASFVAADLLSQAEHGTDSQVLLVSTSNDLITEVLKEIGQQLKQLPRKDMAAKALSHSKAIAFSDMSEAIDLINEYAAEHLIINCNDAALLANKIRNAGSVFIGKYAPESVGDYASGTNHTLPTNGFAKAYSGVSVDSFVKKITYQQLNEKGISDIGETVVRMAEAEDLQAHANAVKIRLQNLSTALQNRTGSFEKPADDGSLVWKGVDALVRDNIKELKPYSSARSEYSGTASIFLDANENSFGSPLTKWYNRYPDPLQWELKKKISTIKNVPPANMLLGNGSDECIDLLVRAFCEPKQDNIIICPPTYGMYEVTAHINDVQVREVPLLSNYQLNLNDIEKHIDSHTKLIFLCSPNNPTGNSLDPEDIEVVLHNFHGLVVVDEAYINYSRFRSFSYEIIHYPNLVVLQTFSKAWGLAALRLGMLFAQEDVVHVLNNIKPPYNINQSTQELVMKALDHLDDVNAMIKETVDERELLSDHLLQLPFVQRIIRSDANFLLVKMTDADQIYEFLKSQGIIVRNRTNVILCEDCLRITVGTPEQNKQLFETLTKFKSKSIS